MNELLFELEGELEDVRKQIFAIQRENPEPRPRPTTQLWDDDAPGGVVDF